MGSLGAMGPYAAQLAMKNALQLLACVGCVYSASAPVLPLLLALLRPLAAAQPACRARPQAWRAKGRAPASCR